jgi:hypothetical protein
MLCEAGKVDCETNGRDSRYFTLLGKIVPGAPSQGLSLADEKALRPTRFRLGDSLPYPPTAVKVW